MRHRSNAPLKGRLQFLISASGRAAGVPIKAHEPCHAGNLQDLQAIAQSQVHEHVTGEERQLEVNSPVLPARTDS